MTTHRLKRNGFNDNIGGQYLDQLNDNIDKISKKLVQFNHNIGGNISDQCLDGIS